MYTLMVLRDHMLARAAFRNRKAITSGRSRGVPLAPPQLRIVGDPDMQWLPITHETEDEKDTLASSPDESDTTKSEIVDWFNQNKQLCFYDVWVATQQIESAVLSLSEERKDHIECSYRLVLLLSFFCHCHCYCHCYCYCYCLFFHCHLLRG